METAGPKNKKTGLGQCNRKNSRKKDKKTAAETYTIIFVIISVYNTWPFVPVTPILKL